MRDFSISGMEPMMDMADDRRATRDTSRSFSERWRSVPAEVRARVDARVARTPTRMALADLRRSAGATQVDQCDAGRPMPRRSVLRTLGVGQASISKLESAADMSLSTLRHAVKALGGELERTIRFSGTGPIAIGRFATMGADRAKRGGRRDPSGTTGRGTIVGRAAPSRPKPQSQ